MSSETTEAPKKKGKLPIVVVLLLVLGGGGFFAFKMKSGGAKPKPAVKLGAVEPLAEFLVNLNDGASYIRTEVSLQFVKDYKKETFDANLASVRDAIILKLTSKSPSELKSLDGKRQLKRELAAVVNKALIQGEAESADKPKQAEAVAVPDPSAKPIHPDWESDTGPVLRVFFTSLATQ